MSYNYGNPSSIKCSRCRIVKNSEAFSRNSLAKLGQILSRPGLSIDARRHPQIACINCTPSQVHELKCNMCDKTKALEHFAKSQRRNPDKALCNGCQQDRSNMPTNDEACSDESSLEDSSEEDTDEDDDNCPSLTSGSIAPSGSVASTRSGLTTTTNSARSSDTRSTTSTLRTTPGNTRSGGSGSGGVVGRWAKIPTVQPSSLGKNGSLKPLVSVPKDESDSDDREIASDEDSDEALYD